MKAMIRATSYDTTVSCLAASEHRRSSRHLDHCFDYLRQAILCAGDTTIEWAAVDPDGQRRRFDGWGIPHWHCKSTEEIDKFLDSHLKYNDSRSYLDS